MNFQAVNVAQKLDGYLDAKGTPSAALQGALDHTDQSMGRIVAALRQQQIFQQTVVVLTAKHGQTPIDPSQLLIVDSSLIPTLVNGVQSGLLLHATEDDIGLLWLSDQTKCATVAANLNADTALHIDTTLACSDSLVKQGLGDPLTDPRTPDIIVLPTQGVIYANPTTTKIADHGGFGEEDTNVALVVANPLLNKGLVSTSVQTKQIAPTILRFLGRDPNSLQAVVAEDTQVLPSGPIPLFAGVPGKPNCRGESFSALAQQYGGMAKAASALGYSSVGDLQAAIQDFCTG